MLVDNTANHSQRWKLMTDEEIVARIRDGGKAMDAGVKALFERFAQPMLRFFVYQGLPGDEAKDVLQETFIKIARGARGFTGEGAAKGWLWQIARNCLMDHMRKKASSGDHELVLDEEGWHKLIETTAAPASRTSGTSVDECVTAGLDAFAQVMPERAYVLTLQMDGTSIEEIGQQIGRTATATKEYLSQCKRKIQPFIAHCTELLTA